MDFPSFMNPNRTLKRNQSQVGSLASNYGSSMATGTPTSLSSYSPFWGSYRPSSYQAPSSYSSSYLAKLQHDFMKDFLCCGLVFPTLHDLLQHYEEKHPQQQSSSDTIAEHADEDLEHLLEEHEPVENQVISNPSNIVQIGPKSLEDLFRLWGVPPRPSPLPLLNSAQPDLGSITETSLHTASKAPVVTESVTRKEPERSDGVVGITEALEDFKPYTPRQEEKPFKCPVRGCEKAYRNENGLKYHKRHGHWQHLLNQNEDGTFSIVSYLSVESSPGIEKEKPHKCEACNKRYKNLNGLKYHKSHSPYCKTKLESLDLDSPASASSPDTPPLQSMSPAGDPSPTVEVEPPTKENVEPTITPPPPPPPPSPPPPPQPTPSSSTHKKQKTSNTSTFKCEQCDKTFTRATSLNEHRLRHTNERPYKCSALEGCDQRFFSPKDCKRHEAIHTGEKKFVCEDTAEDGTKVGCGREFGRADHLAAHRRTNAGRACVAGRDEDQDHQEEEEKAEEKE